MKKYLLGLIALVTAITLNSFTVKTSKHPTVTKNFTYIAYPNDSHVNDPNYYTLTGNDGSDDLNCPDGNSHRCGVIAEDNGSGLPDLSQAYTIATRN